MKKGIVMEIDDEFLTLLTPDGQFLRAKKQKPCALGEEILFTPVKKFRPINRFLGIKQLSAAAVVMLILFGSFLPMYQNNKAYAYMSIDTNPSIELGINKKMQVIKVTPYNSAGEKIISHLGSWKKTGVAVLTQTIIKEMEKMGYLKKDHSVVISTVRTGKSEVNTDAQLTKNVNEIKQMVIENNLDPIVINGTEQDMEKAHRLGITTGKYKEEKQQINSKYNHSQQQNGKPETENNGVGKESSESSTVPSAATAGIQKGNAGSPGKSESSSSKGTKDDFSTVQLKKEEGPSDPHENKAWPQAKQAMDEEKNSSNGEQSKNQNQSEEKNHDKGNSARH